MELRGSTCRPQRRECTDGRRHPPLQSHDAIVAAFIDHHRKRADDELEFCRGLPSLREAVRTAALARTREGTRHPHQRRIPAAVLHESAAHLLSIVDQLEECRSFDELHDLVSSVIGPIHGIGRLTAYDTAARIGAHRGLEPAIVYLHAGTAIGARALGFTGKRTLDPRLLPSAFGVLRPREIEDCLCIFKMDLARLKGKC